MPDLGLSQSCFLLQQQQCTCPVPLDTEVVTKSSMWEKRIPLTWVGLILASVYHVRSSHMVFLTTLLLVFPNAPGIVPGAAITQHEATTLAARGGSTSPRSLS